MTAKNENIKKVTVDGITVEIDLRALKSFDFFDTMTIGLDEEESDEARMVATGRMMRLVFGDQFSAVKKALNEKHDGFAPLEAMQEFIGDVMEKVDAKN